MLEYSGIPGKLACVKRTKCGHTWSLNPDDADLLPAYVLAGLNHACDRTGPHDAHACACGAVLPLVTL